MAEGGNSFDVILMIYDLYTSLEFRGWRYFHVTWAGSIHRGNYFCIHVFRDGRNGPNMFAGWHPRRQ
jgi:hypothetical protein